ncbi:MAG: hypothetical protein WEE66_02070 [Actinomycetota bacterium]
MSVKKNVEDSTALGALPEQISRPCGWCGRSAWLRRRVAVQAGWYSTGARDD